MAISSFIDPGKKISRMLENAISYLTEKMLTNVYTYIDLVIPLLTFLS